MNPLTDNFFLASNGGAGARPTVPTAVYAAIHKMVVRMPRLPTLPEDIEGYWSVTRWLLDGVAQATKWTSYAEEAKSLPFIWSKYVSDYGKGNLEKVVPLLENMRNRSPPTTFSPLLWSWWRLTRLHEKGLTYSQAVARIWDYRLLAKPFVRRFFYEDFDFTALYSAVLWPEAACRAYSELVVEHGEATAMDGYAIQGALERAQAEAAMNKLVEKQDLSLWLAIDKVGLLKLRGICRNALEAPAPAVKRRGSREKKT